jgi:hypothetical protein
MSALDRTERFVVQAVHVTLQGEIQECLNSTTRGYTMPAFTFEKLSPPVRREPVAPIADKKQRGVIVQMLDRFVEARVKRTLQAEEKGVVARYEPPE